MTNTAAGILSWRDLADALGALAKTEGSPRFLEEAFRLLNRLVTVDSCAVFKISADKISGAQHLCTFGTLDGELADFLAERYVSQGFLNDPVVQTALPMRSRVRHVPRAQYSEAYRSDYFRKADLIDKVTSLHSSRTALFSVNFYRVTANGKFSNQDLSDLERLGPILSQYVLRHVSIAADKALPDRDFVRRRVDLLLDDGTTIFAQLSERERQVCKRLLLGMSEKELAADLGVALTTVVTYRQRLYAKLGITSKEELFQRALVATA